MYAARTRRRCSSSRIPAISPVHRSASPSSPKRLSRERGFVDKRQSDNGRCDDLGRDDVQKSHERPAASDWGGLWHFAHDLAS